MTKEYTRKTADDGTVTESYYTNGKLHREDGPAVIEHRADGFAKEQYYLDGVLFRPNVPTPVVVERNVSEDSTTESYARDGKVYHIVTQYGPYSSMKTGGGCRPPSAPSP